jgi:uncharacterized protein (TIGR00730 family)
VTDDVAGAAEAPQAKPRPPHPFERRRALPGCALAPESGGPEAAEAVRAIIASPGYRPADEDPDFLRRDDTRGARLQLDYLKPELLLRDHRVARTIVVFGGTRIEEPQAARRAVDACAAAAAANPGSAAAQRALARARRIQAKSHYYDMAREFGRLVGAAGSNAPSGRIVIMTGGGPGIMEATSRGAHDVGAPSIGLNIALQREQYPNPYVTPDLCFRFHYFAIRKLHFLLRARALVAFPGGYGTMDELFEVLTLAQTRKIRPVPVILVGEAYWRRVFDPDFLVDEGVIDPEDRELFWFAESAAEIWNDILSWYEAAGEPLLPAG